MLKVTGREDVQLQHPEALIESFMLISASSAPTALSTCPKFLLSIDARF
jgi:hypothetical protein